MRGILTYHSIDDLGSPISLRRETLARHAAFLAGGRVRVVPFAEILSVPPDEDALAITFDDGLESFAREAWPVLRARDLPVTLFVVSDRAGGTNDWDAPGGLSIPSQRLLGWNELRALVDQGVELGAHGRTHASLPGLAPERLADEVRGSKARIADETGKPPRTFAYPFGDLDEASASLVRGEFEAACTTELRLLGENEDAALIPRLDAWYLQAPGRLESFGTPAFRRFVAFRRALRRARTLLRG